MKDARPDVLVVGGGAAGVGAAVGAARAGARVRLVERAGFLGGLATSALVGTVCGLHLRRTDGAVAWAVHGFPRELGERLAAAGRTAPVSWRHGLVFLPYEPFALRRLLDLVLAEAGVVVGLHTDVVAARREGDRVVALSLRAGGTVEEVAPAQVIDTTGLAQVAALAGAPVDEDPDYQAAAYVISVCGLRPIDEGALRLGLATALRRAVDAGHLPPEGLAVSVVPGSLRGGRVYLKLGLPGRVRGEADEVTALEQRARRVAAAVVDHLVAAEPVFADALVADVASQVGARTGRRLRGLDRLEDGDVTGARARPDGVAPGAWPVEIWGEGTQPELDLPPDGRVYEIPAGALRAADLVNLRMAGRHLSASARAVASARVIGTCLATGYAAGRLAAGAAAGRRPEDDVAFLRGHLIDGSAGDR